VTVRRTGIWRGPPKRCLTRGAAKSGGRNSTGRITVWHRGGGARKVLRDVDFRRAAPAAAEGVVERLEYDPGRSAYLALLRHDTGKGAEAVAALASRAAALRPAADSSGSSTSPSPSSSSSSSSSGSGSSSSGGGAGPSNGGGGPGGAPSEEYLAAVSDLLAALKAARRAAPRGPPQQFSYIVAPQELKPGDAVASGDGAPIRPGNMMRLRDIPVGMPIHNLEMRPGQGAALCRCGGGVCVGG
jgi:hypothetical protein